VPPGGWKENVQQLNMTLLFAAFERTGAAEYILHYFQSIYCNSCEQQRCRCAGWRGMVRRLEKNAGAGSARGGSPPFYIKIIRQVENIICH
jgi:hypothetical protein